MSSLTDLPPALTVEEVAETLRIGRTAAYDAIRRGEIPSIRVGRSIRVPRCRLAELLGEDALNVSSPPEQASSTSDIGAGAACDTG